jgi:hypothetical protein
MLPMLAPDCPTMSAIVAAQNPRVLNTSVAASKDALLCGVGSCPTPRWRHNGITLARTEI